MNMSLFSLALTPVPKFFLEAPFPVPSFCIHTQSTERSVKQVTEAAGAVVGQEARVGFIRARAMSRKLMPSFKTKKNIMELF